MTITKAKLYKTAVVTEDYEGYILGDIVGVKFLGKSNGLCRFQVSAEYLNRPIVCMNEMQLTDFVM